MVKKKEVQLILILVGVLMLVVSWQFVYKDFQERAAAIEAENAELQVTVDRLEELNAKKPQYIADTELMQVEGNRIINSFASGVTPEDQVMYLYNMERVAANEVRVPSVSMSAAQAVPYSGALTTEEGYELVDDGIGMYSLTSTVNIITTNSGLKNLLDYVYHIDSRKSVSNVNLRVSNDGYLAGSMLVNFYYLTGTEVPYIEPKIQGVSMGTDNFFGVLDGGGYSDRQDVDMDEDSSEDSDGADESGEVDESDSEE